MKRFFGMFSTTSMKLVVAGTTMLLCICLIIVGSFSWFTEHQTILNNTASKRMSVEVVETFQSPTSMRDGEKIEKNVTIKNDGDVPALIRVAVDEALALFEIDPETGNLKQTAYTSPTNLIRQSDITTWLATNVSQAYTTDSTGKEETISGKYFDVSSVLLDTNIGYLDSDRTAAILDYFTITFGDVGMVSGHKWIYENGYFYYTEKVDPGSSTQPLVYSVEAAEGLPNTYKGMYYKMDISASSVQPLSSALVEWWSTTPAAGTSAAYDALSLLVG